METMTAQEQAADPKFRPKSQEKFVPSTDKAHRSPLQLPDISVTGEEVQTQAPEQVDEISKAS